MDQLKESPPALSGAKRAEAETRGEAVPNPESMVNRETAQAGAMSAMLKWALLYARLGLAVFPVHTIRNGWCSCGKPDCKRSAGKHPMTRHGYKDATTDPATLRNWWTLWPDANIGIATGRVSGIVVLDVDGEDGEQRLAKFAREYGVLPPTAEVKTPRGRHLYFRYPPGVDHVPSVAKGGLDIRADAGFVIAPPSLHFSGERYAWVTT
jgi:hypothetical protein